MTPSLITRLDAETERREGKWPSVQIETMRAMLNKAADQFAFYADEHAKKGTKEADDKAAVNHQWALACARAANGDNP